MCFLSLILSRCQQFYTVIKQALCKLTMAAVQVELNPSEESFPTPTIMEPPQKEQHDQHLDGNSYSYEATHNKSLMHSMQDSPKSLVRENENFAVGGIQAPATPTKPPAEQQQTKQQTQTADKSTLLRAQAILSSSVGVPKVRAHWTHRYMKILLVGEDGVGRTTLLRNLFGAYAPDPSGFAVADGSAPGARKAFYQSPERLATEVTVQDKEQKVSWHYIVQDTPGLFGDISSSVELADEQMNIMNLIRQSRISYFEAERDPGRRTPVAHRPDCRMDVCLYLLPPHTMRRVDIDFMKRIAQEIPLIPVLTKADAMTREELKEFRTRLQTVLSDGQHVDYQNQHYQSDGVWTFSKEAMAAAGDTHGPPYATICSKDMDKSVSTAWPVREYDWGKCETLLAEHSDLPILRKLLFETGYHELKEQTELKYHQHRSREAQVTILPRPLNGLVKVLGAVIAIGVASAAVSAGLPILKDTVRRKETVRRVKAAVGEVAEKGVEVVDTARDTAKDFGRKALRAVETEEAKLKREEEEARQRRPWWKLW